MTFKHNTFSAIAAFTLIFIVFNTQLAAEFVFLKDGSIIEGDIVNDAAESVTILTKEKKQKQIPRDKLIRILYSKLKMGKIYIQKRDGDSIVAYIVDEDQESYTFRKELYKPEEFVLKREDVLFMAEKNPSGLKVSGEIGTDRVSLVWLPPFDEVKKYNIYIKKNKSDKYELIDSTGSKSITLKNLSSNTTYFLTVTSIDSSDYESPPSNELKITTKNIPPTEPDITSSGDIKAEERIIVWNTSTDLDGNVEKYRIYGTKDDKREMIAEIKKSEYVLKKALSYDKVEIRAVDNSGEESDTANVKLFPNTFLDLYPGVIIPLGKFSEMYEIGYGGLISISERNFIFKNFEAGIALGFYYMQGKNILAEKNLDYQTLMFAPLYLTAEYNFRIGDSFAIKPGLSIGGVYLDAKYVDRNRTAVEGRDMHLQTFEPAFKAGLSARYMFTDYLSLTAGCEYGAVVEKNGLLSFITANAGIGYSF